MSDKELIKQEIEKRLSLLWDLIPEGEKVLKDDFTKDDANNLGKYTALESLLQFIDSLPEESASEDLEEEMIRWHKEYFGNKRDWEKTSGEYLTRKTQLDIARHFAEWQKKKDQETIELAEDHAMLAGMNRMKEEMMKDAVDGEYWDGSIYLDNRPTEYKDGDKVKILIIKDE